MITADCMYVYCRLLLIPSWALAIDPFCRAARHTVLDPQCGPGAGP